jgi:hypothetical protein
MKLIILTAAFVIGVFFNSCNLSTENGSAGDTKLEAEFVKENNSIPFEIGKGFFVKNSFDKKQFTNPKITTKEEFENIFGYATTMGENGKPSSIDFSKEFVIAVIGEVTDKISSFDAIDLIQESDSIVLNYKEIEGEKITYKMQPCLVLIVNNTFKGKVYTYCSK